MSIIAVEGVLFHFAANGTRAALRGLVGSACRMTGSTRLLRFLGRVLDRSWLFEAWLSSKFNFGQGTAPRSSKPFVKEWEIPWYRVYLGIVSSMRWF